MTLSALAPELLEKIFWKLSGAEFKAIRLTCRKFQKVAFQVLPEKVTIQVEKITSSVKEPLIRGEQSERLHRLSKEGVLVSTKSLVLASFAPLKRSVEETKKVVDPIRLRWREEGDVGICIQEHIVPCIRLFDQSKLEKIELRTCPCLPLFLLGECRVLSVHEPHLKSLKVSMDPYSCKHEYGNGNTEAEPPRINLSGFKNLQSLAWSYVRTMDHFKAISECMYNNSTTLESLELSTWLWDKMRRNAPQRAALEDMGLVQDAFAGHILGLKLGEKQTLFPKLRTLLLSGIVVERPSKEFAHAFNFSGLRRLGLWNCDRTQMLLEMLVYMNLKICLTDFELVKSDAQASSQPEISLAIWLAKFLDHFRGLEKLYVMIRGSTAKAWQSVCEAITRKHSATLRSVVLHHRARDYFCKDEDYLNSSPDCEFRWTAAVAEIMRCPSLDFIGLSCGETLKYITLPESRKESSFRVLHLRRSALPAETAEFANLLFGPDGFRNLQLLVCGDVSDFGQSRRLARLYCRREPGEAQASDRYCRFVNKQDTALRRLAVEHIDALRACAVPALGKARAS